MFLGKVEAFLCDSIID